MEMLRATGAAMSRAEVCRALAEFGLGDRWLADAVHRDTAGRSDLVRLVGPDLTIRPGSTDWALGDTLAEHLGQAGTDVAAYVADELLRPLPNDLLPQVALLAHLGPVDAGLCRALGQPVAALAELVRRGLLVSNQAGALRYRLVPVVAAVARQLTDEPSPDTEGLVRIAADWYAGHDAPGAAARAHRRVGDRASVLRLLTERGADILVSDGAHVVIELVADLPESDRTRPLSLLYGEALSILGDLSSAQAVFEGLATDPELEVAVAMQLGRVEYRRGRPQDALRTFARAQLSGATVDSTLLLAWQAAACMAVGDQLACRTAAEKSHQYAVSTGDRRVLAAAHMALAFAADLAGDCAAERQHHERALQLAEAAGDAVQEARCRTNLSSRLLVDTRYVDALAEASRAATLAEAVGYRTVLGIALSNAGEALTRLGRLDEAVDMLERAIAVERRTCSGRVALPLMLLGDVHRVRGHDSLAQAAYDQAVGVCGDGDRQALVPALAGLATVLAEADPVAAVAYAEEAGRHAAGRSLIVAQVASARVAFAAGDRASAGIRAEQAAELARLHGDCAGLAVALELIGAAADSTRNARRAFTEALAIWRDAAALPDLCRVAIRLGELSGATVSDRVNGRLAGEELARMGVAVPERGDSATTTARPVVIRTLGRFEVTVGGEQVPSSAWQSRKARDLLRILVARRGRGIARDELAALLWAGEDADRVGHRLSVALSTVRTVLDPMKLSPADPLVISSPCSVALDASRMTLDFEAFLTEAAHGLRLHERGDVVAAQAVLAHAEAAYTGDFYEDEPYDDWSSAVREEVRAAYLRVVRTLAELCRLAGDTDAVVAYLHRLLAKDPYDEQCHLDLIDTLATAGCHGEARRAHHHYRAAMERIGINVPQVA